ncbi:5-hydroxyisourate hydrolase (purine catabolism), transthyretin-related family [Kushneria avicenniae]|uniref:5-hydroxyisourate hydrolase (Purine catabolism), transthyretin-related family n=1 Tax=Kushneria avicenniae TaxID=402385 RepID=A0A1I1FG74_9GAMM|nr:hydroxyisourate hydrolase [Kushneria avicenniae]SFB96698.1 5-hydroxyisourate hydrolase (purine catabolism), transthyretin-related family [Kushneria avicenniae]
MATLTTRVLDQYEGIAVEGMVVSLEAHGDEEPIMTLHTNASGALDEALLQAGSGGHYRLIYHVRDYFLSRGVNCLLLDQVPADLTMARGDNEIIVLLVSPWGYSVHRDSASVRRRNA